MSESGESYPNKNPPPGKNYPHYQDRHGHRRHAGEHFPKNYEMNADEKAVLKECQTESFWYRALPLAVGAGLVTQALISRGTLTTGSRIGSLPKIAFAGLIGYMAGKMSYVNVCKQKFLRLENSPIADLLRKGGTIPQTQPGNISLPSFSPTTGSHEKDGALSDSFSSFGHSDDYRADLDIDTSNVKTMDSQFDFELSKEAASELEAKRPEMTKTYEDLRKENRQKYSSKYTEVPPGHYQNRQPPPPPRSQGEKASPHRGDELPFGSKQRTRVMKNKYGDDLE